MSFSEIRIPHLTTVLLLIVATDILGGTKFLREFIFAYWLFLCFAGTNFCD